jgi:hypothetical protein
MEDPATTSHNRILARDAALRKLDRLTAGVAVSAFGAVGLLAALGALTIPGTSPSSAGTSTCVSTIRQSGTTNSDDETSGETSSAETSIQAPSCTVSSSTSAAVVVSGGSHPLKP